VRTATIILPKTSSIVGASGRLTANFLLSLVFLLGIGLAFAQTILQKHRQRLVGEREREFVASVTHELRTPLTAIRAAADNLRRGIVPTERVGTYGEMIHSQSIRLGSMVEEMLLFSKVEGRTPPPPEIVEIKTESLLQELREPLDEIARSAGIRLNWDFGGLPRVFRADQASVRMILNNLVSNALYHAYPDGDHGEVRVLGRLSHPDRLRFTVEDDGRGIQKKESKLVFEPFYRDAESRERHEKGSGLGLFIARRKAELVGGLLSLESPYRRVDGSRRDGCRFTLDLNGAKSDVQ
jgi:signal transduction histidine kinase